MHAHSRRSLTLALAATALFLMAFGPLAATVHAATAQYVPLAGIPGVTDATHRTLPEYINALYLLAIGLGAFVAVVKIMVAGIKYSLSDIVTDKSEAKKDIQGVLLGLAVLLVPYLVLTTINPELTRLDVLRASPQLKVNLTAQQVQNAKIIQDAKTLCESVKGNVFDPEKKVCSGGVPTTDSCTYASAAEKTTCVNRCTSAGGTLVDSPNILGAGQVTGSTKCTFTSRSGQIPM